MYLGAQLNEMYIDGNECWTMSTEKYVNSSVKNVEETLVKLGLLRLPSKCYTPKQSDYWPEWEVSPELNRSTLMGCWTWKSQHAIGSCIDVYLHVYATRGTLTTIISYLRISLDTSEEKTCIWLRTSTDQWTNVQGIWLVWFLPRS